MPLGQPRTADNLHVAVHYQPAESKAQVGGDWYDAFIDAAGATFLTVGDVSGHDRKASLTMRQVLTLLRGLACEAGSAPSRVLSRLDAAMTALPVDALATAVVARFEPRSDHGPGSSQRAHWSSAGHLPPLLRDPDGAVTRLEAEPGLLLGVCPDTPRFDHVVDMKAGSTLLLYTDGLIERRGQNLDEGIDALAATLSALGGLDPEPLCEAIVETTGALRAGDDDVALLVVRATG